MRQIEPIYQPSRVAFFFQNSITTLGGHTAAIREIAISRDGTMLVSGGDDNTLILWNLPRILNVDALAYGCALVQDYLKTNTAVEEARFICTS